MAAISFEQQRAILFIYFLCFIWQEKLKDSGSYLISVPATSFPRF